VSVRRGKRCTAELKLPPHAGWRGSARLASTWHCVWCLLTASRATAQSLFSPVAGVLGDRFHRGFLIAIGTLLWSAFSFLFGFTKTFSQVSACLLHYA